MYFDQLLDFQKLSLLLLQSLIMCNFYTLDAGFFQHHPGVKQFGSRSGPFVGPDPGPNCLQRLSADYKSPQAGKELNTKQLVDATFCINLG